MAIDGALNYFRKFKFYLFKKKIDEARENLILALQHDSVKKAFYVETKQAFYIYVIFDNNYDELVRIPYGLKSIVKHYVVKEIFEKKGQEVSTLTELVALKGDEHEIERRR